MTDDHGASLAQARRIARQADAARVASRRMIARGERPLYRLERVSLAPDVRIRVVELPWLEATAGHTRDASSAGRAAIAAWLGVQPDTFDIEPG